MSVAPQLLIDNDIFILLAGANLLLPAISMLGFGLADAKYLESLRFSMMKPKAKQLYPTVVIARVLQACTDLSVVSDEPNNTLLDQLTSEVGVDSGEAILYALLAEHPSFLLTSNDKNAMRTLTHASSLQLIKSGIAGRVICLETILLMMIEQYGVERIGRALAPVIPINVILRVAFSPSSMTKPDACQFALHHYQQDLVSRVGDNFLWGYTQSS